MPASRGSVGEAVGSIVGILGLVVAILSVVVAVLTLLVWLTVGCEAVSPSLCALLGRAATPTPTPTSVPTPQISTPAVSPVVTRQDHPSPTPTLLRAPELAVMDYYRTVTRHEYDKAWAMLSDGFRLNQSGGRRAYEDWWESVRRSDILTVKLLVGQLA